MEVNRDEAFRCIDLGKTAFQAGELSKALRMFKKSYSMFPNETAKHWIEKAQRETLKTASPTPTTSKPTPTEKPVTKKQKEEVERIIQSKNNYYSVLHVDRSASSKDIEKHYRKLILVIHPDKNSHPQANEAFNILQMAKNCLTDENSREIYNATGRDPAASTTGRSPYAGNRQPFNMDGMHSRHGSYTFTDPEEFFRHFTTNSENYRNKKITKVQTTDPEFIFRSRRNGETSRPQTRRARYARQEEPKNNLGMAALQLFVMLAFAFIVFFSGSSGDQAPQYSLVKTRTYSEERYTQRGVPYYVPRGTKENFTHLEPQIEEAWIRRETRLCAEEKQEREILIARMQYLSPERKASAMQSLNSRRLFHCELLETFLHSGGYH